MDIVCPNCKTLGKIDDNCVGEEINCPQCEHDFICSDQLFNFTPTNKPTATETVEPVIAEPATKKCPYCAELIKIEASRCKHCNVDFQDKKNEKKGIIKKIKDKRVMCVLMSFYWILSCIGAFITVMALKGK